MAKRGPKPTPIKILRNRGSWRGNLNKNEPQPELGRPVCPQWLSKDAKRVWRAIVPMLDAMGLLSKIDRNALIRYCDAWVRWRKAAEFLTENGEGYPVKDAAGQVRLVKKWPQADTYSDMCAILSRLEAEFGLTPSARSRIIIPGPPKEKAAGIAKYMNKQAQ